MVNIKSVLGSYKLRTNLKCIKHTLDEFTTGPTAYQTEKKLTMMDVEDHLLKESKHREPVFQTVA